MVKHNVHFIAEAGVNHNGSLELAMRLVDVAIEAGADSVKFQTFKTENLVSRTAPKAEYQKASTGANESQFDMIKRLELSYDEFRVLKKYCDGKGIQFLSTAFDLESIDFLNSLGIPIFKIPSGEITNFPYLREIGKLGKQVILSTGMSTLDEIRFALATLERFGTPKKNVTVLHRNSAYPTPAEDTNLRAIATLRAELGTAIGFSDHSEGIELSVAALGFGATVIEKHFTTSKALPGPDHRASLAPDELCALVKAVRLVEKAMGTGAKVPSDSERVNLVPARKSIATARAIRAGETFSEANLTTLRPSSGLSPMNWESLLGRKAKRTYQEHELIESSEVDG